MILYGLTRRSIYRHLREQNHQSQIEEVQPAQLVT